MALPLRYTLRNLAVRRASALFTALGVAMTVAVFAGVLSLRAGFEQLYRPQGRSDLAVYLRPGATSEGESAIRREQVEILLKERPEIVRDARGRPQAAAETYLAVYMEKAEGGLTNVPLRGVQPASIALRGEALRLVEGRWFEFGADEVVVGSRLAMRMRGCLVGDVIHLNLTPFRVVGILDAETAERGEVWGDAERMMDALQRHVFQRVLARVQPDTDLAAVADALEHDARVPMTVKSEPEYLASQTSATGFTLSFLAGFLTFIMGLAAILGSINTMLASVAARTHEIGVLLAIGYSRAAVFMAFLLEAALIGLLGGGLGLLLALPFDGLETGLSNFNTFTDASFAFRLTPRLALTSFGLAFTLGVLGGTLPALRAASLRPVEAFRQL